MPSRQTMGEAAAKPPITWDEFATIIQNMVPGLRDLPLPETRVSEVWESDRLLRAQIVHAIEFVCGQPPETLLLSIDTFGEAWEWAAQRASAPSACSVPGVVLEPYSSLRVRLRVVRPADVQLAYEHGLSPAVGFRWIFRGTTPTPEQFTSRISQASLCQYVIERRDVGVALGIVDAYEPSLTDRHVKVSVMSLRPQAHGGGAVGEVFEGLFFFLCYLFDTFDLRRVCYEIPGFNWPQFASGESSFFTVEGVLKEHDYYRDQFWDRRIAVTTRAAFVAVRETWEPVLTNTARQVGQ